MEVERVDADAFLLAEYIAQQLEKRVAFRRTIRMALQRAQRAGVLGLKIQVGGRLNGAEIARTEWTREGRVPLHTLRAEIDYATREANTTYGVLGIKVWVFKGEVLLKKNKLSLWVRALRGKLVEDLSNLRIVQMRIHRRYKNA